jgi:hypothetical protein
MLSVPTANWTPDWRILGKLVLTTWRAQCTFCMMAGWWASPCSMPVGWNSTEKVQISQAAFSIISCTSASVASAPCSMVETPSSSAQRKPGPPWAWAAA